MEKETAERFFQNIKWLNDFFSDLRNLFDKISSIIEKELGYSEKSYYYYKSNDMPSIPSGYFLLLSGEGKLGLQITAVFDKEKVTNNKFFFNEPTIIVVLHNWRVNDTNTTWITWNIVEGKNIKEIDEDGGLISGIFDASQIEFYAFQVSLDMFSEYKDQTVKEQIVARINEVFDAKKT